MKVIISGGGTGGHIFPAIAIANSIKELVSCEILFVGASNRMEMELVPKAGYNIIGLEVSGLIRKLTLKNIVVLYKLLKSMAKAKKIIKDFKPDLVIGVGGYVSGPVLRIASNRHIPTLIQEQNSFPGITNKLLAKKADKICVAYAGLEKFFPQDKIIITGNPIRQNLINISDSSKRDEAGKYFDLDPMLKTVLVVGGSLGAKTINEAMFQMLPEVQQQQVQILWQTGKHFSREKIEMLNIDKRIKITTFIDRIDLAYSLADIIVSRAGAIAISELCVIGKACILIPSPNVSEDHQTKNAMALVNNGAALMVKDNEAIQTLLPTIKTLLADSTKCGELSHNIKMLAKTHAADDIAKIALSLISYK